MNSQAVFILFQIVWHLLKYNGFESVLLFYYNTCVQYLSCQPTQTQIGYKY